MAPERLVRTLTLDEVAHVACIALGVLPNLLPLDQPAGPHLELRDPEGVPLATWDLTSPRDAAGLRTWGTITALNDPTLPTYRELRRSPADVVREFGSIDTVAVVGVAPPPAEILATTLTASSGQVIFLAAAGGVRADDAGHHRAIRAWQHAASQHGAPLVLTPLWAGASDETYATVARAYGAERFVRGLDEAPAAGSGAVVFFTGLSGSGKSTIAARLVSLLTEDAARTVTLLDGDVVRTHLSSELGFSKTDRDTNVRRIGWVAAEAAKHGGIAVAAPIAPYVETRQAVRAMVERQAGPGAFVLIHVSTSLAECERRDRKGLYAKARAGLIPSFTGISDPYEPPTDAALVIDTEVVGAAEAVERIRDLLVKSGKLAP